MFVVLCQPDHKDFKKALKSMRGAGDAAVSVLEEALRDADPFVRRQAAWLLGEVGKPARARSRRSSASRPIRRFGCERRPDAQSP
jgi:HEAT repeat protein